jgi:thiamine transport system substrate-binding protein
MKRLAVVLAALMLLAACGDDSSPQSGAAVTITLLTHDSFAVSDGLLDGFTEQTGITVKVLQAGDAGVMVNQAILTKGKPLGDVLFGVDNTFLTRAVDAGIFEPYSSPALSDVRPDLADQTAGGAVTPIDFGDVCLNYDKAYFDKHELAPPTSLESLTKPEYKDLLVVENPATSSPGLAFMLGTVAQFGPDGFLDYWKQLKVNGVAVSDGWEDAYNTQFSGSAGKGPKPIVVSYASSPPAEVIFAETPLTDAPTAAVPTSCFRQIEFAGVLAGTKHPAAAQAFIDFMLSTTFQNDMPLNMFVYPAITKALLPDAFAKYSVVPEQPLTLPPDEIAANRDKWIEEWTSTVLG